MTLLDVPAELAEDFYNGMSVEQLANCGRHPLVTIGSHTVSHPFLCNCNADQLTYELMESRRVLQQITDQDVDLIAYPTGDYDFKVIKAVISAGYRAAFAVTSHCLNAPRFEIPRVDLYSSRESYLSLKLSGIVSRAIKGPII